jgi:hypothetical protein
VGAFFWVVGQLDSALPWWLARSVAGLIATLAARVAPEVFPWKAALTYRDRQEVLGGAGAGGAVAFAAAVAASFLVLDPNLSAPIHSHGAMICISIFVEFGAFGSAYLIHLTDADGPNKGPRVGADQALAAVEVRVG